MDYTCKISTNTDTEEIRLIVWFILAKFLLIPRRGLGGKEMIMRRRVTVYTKYVYTCKVSTYNEERNMRMRVTVYSKYGLYF